MLWTQRIKSRYLGIPDEFLIFGDLFVVGVHRYTARFGRVGGRNGGEKVACFPPYGNPHRSVGIRERRQKCFL